MNDVEGCILRKVVNEDLEQWRSKSRGRTSRPGIFAKAMWERGARRYTDAMLTKACDDLYIVLWRDAHGEYIWPADGEIIVSKVYLNKEGKVTPVKADAKEVVWRDEELRIWREVASDEDIELTTKAKNRKSTVWKDQKGALAPAGTKFVKAASKHFVLVTWTKSKDFIEFHSARQLPEAIENLAFRKICKRLVELDELRQQNPVKIDKPLTLRRAPASV